MNKSDRILKYFDEKNIDGKIDATAHEVAEKIGCCPSFVKILAKGRGITFRRRKPARKRPKTEMYVKAITRIIEENPEITYREIGEALGVTKQMVFSIAKEYNIDKKNNSLRPETEEKIREFIRNNLNDKGALTKLLLSNNINPNSYKKYKRIHANDPELSRFDANHKRDRSKKSKIISYLAKGNMSLSEIAKTCNVGYQYVWRIRKEIKEMENSLER